MTSKEFLKYMNKLSVEEQTIQKEGIIEYFREFWATNPTEEEFSEIMSGLVIFPEISYIMVSNKR